jgi:hypothetical protein
MSEMQRFREQQSEISMADLLRSEGMKFNHANIDKYEDYRNDRSTPNLCRQRILVQPQSNTRGWRCDNNFSPLE